MKTPTRLLIVEDHAILRDGLRTILADYQDFDIVGEAEDGFDALRQCEACSPDLVLLDLTLPKLEGVETMRRIKEKWPGTAVLVLTMHGNMQSFEGAMKAGADGYCLKDAPLEELLRAMRTVCEGKKYISSEMRRFCESSWTDDYSRPSAGEAYAISLTKREKEILRLIAEGHTNPKIAALLSISERTVDNHCTNLRCKVGAHSKRDLTAYAFRAGLAE